MKIRTVIVDDEPHAREGIRIRLQKYPNIDIIQECSSGTEAVSVIDKLHPDLVFLDIQMPEMNGFEVLKSITAVLLPIIIFVTAYDKYAIQAFECHAVDYLLKPINENRFKEALRVALAEVRHRNLEVYAGKLNSVMKDYFAFIENDTITQQSVDDTQSKKYVSRLMIKSKDHISMMPIKEIEWIESAGDYVYIHSKSQRQLVRETLMALEEKLDPKNFVRIHRSTIVNVEQVKSLSPNEHGDYDVFLHNGIQLKLSRSYRTQFEKSTGTQL
jgi:two-component system, LytTR family, response regulator